MDNRRNAQYSCIAFTNVMIRIILQFRSSIFIKMDKFIKGESFNYDIFLSFSMIKLMLKNMYMMEDQLKKGLPLNLLNLGAFCSIKNEEEFSDCLIIHVESIAICMISYLALKIQPHLCLLIFYQDKRQFQNKSIIRVVVLIRKFKILEFISLIIIIQVKQIQLVLVMDQTNLAIQNINTAKQAKQQQSIQPVSFSELFRFSTKFDWLLMLVGSLCACGMGTALPLFTLFWGDLTNSFGNSDKMVESVRGVMYNFIYLGISALASGWGMFACWIVVGERQGVACRREYLKSLLKQEIGWFDTINQSQLATKFATDSFAFQGAIGQKVSTLIMTIAMFIAGFSIAFSKGWIMTLVCIAGLPLIFVGGTIYGVALQTRNDSLQKEYGKAGGLVEQAVSGIKTIKQLNGQSFEVQNYRTTLKDVTAKSSKFGMMVGFGIGTLFFAMLTTYSLGFWFGSHCVQGSSVCMNDANSRYTAGDTLVIFFSILMAGFNFSQVTPALKKIAEGRIAAARIYKIIDRQPQIKSIENALKPNTFNGFFKFEGVSFAYPKDKNRKILDNLTLEIGQKSTAFVGESGCGKSTIFQLMMRFYDPDEGRITVDGVDLKELDLNWLRSHIGYVGQQPVLFAASLRENLVFGKEEATQEQINEALKKAEAFDFVNELKEKLDTFAGTAGGQISGGQKQRLAIARALLKNPKILLLDEATSALDRRNQKLIQNTLNKIAEERSTVTIAHRIKTVMNCQEIFVLNKGKIVQKGKFQQLQKYKHAVIEKQEHQEQLAPKKQKKFVKQQEGKAKSQQAATKEDIDKKQAEQLSKKYDDQTFGRLFGYVERKGLFVIGILASICNGMVFPIFSIFLAKMLAALIKFYDDPAQARIDANLYALLYLLLGVASFTFCFTQLTIFSIIGSQVTEKVRNETYEKILKMPIVWFDKPKNSCGGISARLASDCQSINGLVTTYVSITIQSLTTLLTGIIIAFIFEWRTTLVALGLIPLMIIAGAIQMAFMTGFSDKTDLVYKDSSNLITQSMINIRTVSSFGYQNMTLRRYEERLQEPLRLATKKGHIAGICYGISQFIMFIVIALIFYIGTIFIRDNNLKIADVFTAIYAILFAGMTAGNNSHFMPDVAVSKRAAANLFQIIDGIDEDQLQIQAESKLMKTPIKGHIIIKNVDFKYPSRDEMIFQDLSLQVKEGMKIGFVGRSGCGKSTIFQLLQRFYEPSSGEITIDGVNLKDYDIHYLRSCLGVVSQEPVLFNETIGNNIKYNKEDATKEDITNAANQSNFNPDLQKEEANNAVYVSSSVQLTQSQPSKNGYGFDKNVGVKGSHISGGQKQRVAIARAVIRQPKILLLDEATSALDSINEQKVQSSLDNIMKNKTSINIAHRLETIRNSDLIMVFQKGRIVEQGTYDELVHLKGNFYKLQQGLELL